MPEFHLDTGGAVTQSIRWGDLDGFTQGYIEAMFFTDSGPDEGQLGDAGFADLAPETLQSIIRDCEEFQAAAAKPLEAVYESFATDDVEQGRNFHYTRNGHGTGFWDRGYDVLGEALSDLAHKAGQRDTYLDCNGAVRLS